MKKKVALLGLCALFTVGVATTTSVCLVNYSHENAIVAYAEGEETETEQPVETETTEPAKTDEVKEWFDKFFAPEMIAMYMSWLAYIGTIIGLVASIKRLKQSNNLTLKNVSDEVKKLIEEVIGTKVAEQFDKIAPKLISGQEKSNEIMSIFAKILALSQENTPESKIAILDLIEQLGVIAKEITQTAKEVVIESKEMAEEAKKELDKKIDEIVESYDGTSI